jgi:sugar-specific transcriptional regulator TrmB
MDVKELQDIGFTQRESKVYTSLLELGSSAVGKLIQKSGIPSSKIYESLEKLKLKGFVSSVIQKNRQVFTAAPPETILDYLDEQRRHTAESLLPKLKILERQDKAEKEATLYEGLRGIKAVYERMLRETKSGGTIYVLGAPVSAQEKLEGYLLDFSRRRLAKGIKMKILYHADAKQYGKKREKMKLTKVKYLRKGSVTPAWVDIFADCIAIFNIEKGPTVNLIRDPEIARSFRNYYEMIWESSK